jgi:penicillin-binding protein 1A
VATYVIRIARHATIAILFIAAALLGILSGVLFAYSDDLPEITRLDAYAPSTITRVMARDGSLVGDFAVERRVVIEYQDIPDVLRQAILAAEDSGFFDHAGLSVSRMALAMVKNMIPGSRTPGRSTLTQQIARQMFPEVGFDRTPERKIKEAIVAIQLEKRYTKPELFTLYCNQMYFGHGAYGVEAASRLYFNKRARELTLPEAALIGGLFQGNARQSPYVHMDAAVRRRNYVLNRMAEEGFISRADADAAMATPIVTRGNPGQASTLAPYFLEEVRKYVEAEYGAKALYESGLTVRTTLDPALQQAANRALDRGVRRVDKRRGWRRPSRNILADEQDLDTFRHDRWSRSIVEGDIVPALVVDVEPKGTGSRARVRIGSTVLTLGPDAFKWTRRTAAADLMKAGDLIEVEVTRLDDDRQPAALGLEQTPLVQGALVAIENRTGQVLAMVGGTSFARSKFNRATQAYRQMGSTFKPILYTAAIDRGLTPATILIDQPTSFNVGEGQPPYTPRNYDGRFEGPVTLRRAVEQSRNIPAVRVMDMLGPTQVVQYAKRFGFPEEFPPYLSAALGAGEANLLEVTSAYSAFPNNGVRLQPYQIVTVTDRENNGLEDNRPQPRDAIRADTAYVMTNLLRGVVLRGTAAAAASLDWPLAGKTGTVDDYTDAWFVGFDPTITVGVWVGYDEKKPLGPGETGSSAALPIWIDFMRAYIDRTGDRSNPPRFEAPGNIIFVAVDRATGEPVVDGTDGAINEAFISGTQPARQ